MCVHVLPHDLLTEAAMVPCRSDRSGTAADQEERQNGGGGLLQAAGSVRQKLPKRDPPGKGGIESGEEGGLLVVQHGEQ